MSNYFDHLLLLLGYRRRSVVSLSVTVVSAAKPVEPIEMPSGLRARMCPRNDKLDGWPVVTEYRGLSVTIVSPAKTAEPIDMLLGLWT